MLKNTVESDGPQMTVWRMRIACWLTKASDAHTEYVILLFFYCYNDYTNATHWYVHVHCLFCWFLKCFI